MENKTKIYALLAVLVALLAVNQFLIFEAGNSLKGAKITAAATKTTSTSAVKTSLDIPMDERGYQMLVQADSQIQLSDEQMKNYVGLNAYIPCCGFQTLQAQGNCQCGHHVALSGLAKYMASQGYTREQIQAEMDNWKVVFYPEMANEPSSGGGLGGC